MTPRSLCLLLALLCFTVATFWAWTPPGSPQPNLVAAGLALLTLSMLVPG